MKRLIILFLLAVGTNLVNPYLASADSYWEYWSSYEIKAKVKEKIDFKVKPEWRFKDDMSQYYYQHVDLGFDWKATKHWTLGAYYRNIDELKSGTWKYEHRPYLDAAYSWKWSQLSFDNRGRVEFRNPEGDGNNTERYRNRFRVRGPKWTKVKIQPFVAVEPFYDFGVDDWTRVRSYAGVSFDITKNIKADVNLIHDADKGANDWSGKNILYSSLKWEF